MEQFEKRQEFEVHVTIKPTENTQPFIKLCESFTEYANSLRIPDTYVYSCKPIIIILPAGVYKQQPMCSMFVSSSLKDAVKFGEIFANYLSKNFSEYEFARNKVEARFKNVKTNLNLDVYNNNSFYWEFHFKLLFDRDEEKIAEFRKNLEKNFPMTRLSKSAMSKYEVTGNVKTSRIVTLRIYSGDKENAKIEFDKVYSYLSKNCFKEKLGLQIVPGTEMELSVYDSNVFHDSGWIPTENSEILNKSSKNQFLTEKLKIIFYICLLLLIFNLY
jgi:hypothetical protein